MHAGPAGNPGPDRTPGQGGRLVTQTAQGLAGLLVVVFFGAALAKVDGYRGWAALVVRLPLPAVGRRFVLVGLPLLEFAAGAITLFASRVGLLLCSVVLACFAAYLLAMMPRIQGMECNCFGAVAQTHIGMSLVVRDLLLALVAAVTAFLCWKAGVESVPLLGFASLALVSLSAVVVLEYRAMPKLGEPGAAPQVGE